MTPILLLALALIPAFSSAADEVSFARDIAPLLGARCASCHLTGQEDGSMTLTTTASYDSIVNKPSVESDLLRVKPGVPEKSYLLLKLQGRHLDAGGSGARMPFGGTPLDSTSLDLISAWIKSGAKP